MLSVPDHPRHPPTTVAVPLPAREPFHLPRGPVWLAPAQRIRDGLRKGSNWFQLVKFGLVGASGYAVNLAAFALLLGAGLHYGAASVGAFAVAVTSNYSWNRIWTFRADRGRVVHQGLRFFLLALAVLAGNLVVLSTLVAFGVDALPAQAIAVAAGMPINFVGNKLWTFSRR
jgi:dolichol-phosphate mannosyltransferase